MLLQVDTLAPTMEQVTTVEETVQESMNLWTMASYGGWIMIILAIMLAGAIYLFVERLVILRKAKNEDKSFMDRIKDYIHEGKIDSARNLCQQTNTPAARMVEKGITRIGRPMQDVQVAIENVGNLEIAKLEKGLKGLSTIASAAPMIGFLGTVIGMVRAFWEMSNAGNNIDVSLLSSGIYEAMITTVGGLIVGIIALFGYNYLVARVDSIANEMESFIQDFTVNLEK